MVVGRSRVRSGYVVAIVCLCLMSVQLLLPSIRHKLSVNVDRSKMNGVSESDIGFRDMIRKRKDSKLSGPALSCRREPVLYDTSAAIRDEYKDFMQSWLYKQENQTTTLIPLDDIENATFIAVKSKGRPGFSITAKAWNATYSVPGRRRGDIAIPRSMLAGKPKILQGDFVVFINNHDNVHAHVLIDHLPALALLREQYPSHYKFLLHDTRINREMMTWLDGIFVRDRVVWFEAGEKLRIDGTLLVWPEMIVEKTRVRSIAAINALRRWIESQKTLEAKEKKSLVVYATRNAPGIRNDRLVDPVHESDVLYLIRKAIKRHERNETLVIYTGAHDDGQGMSFQE